MKISEEEFHNINYWIRVNRDTIKSLYSLFLYICNKKYDLKLIDSKQLYFDLSVYFYYNLYDKYGITLFNNMEEKKKYITLLNEQLKNNLLNEEDDYQNKLFMNNKDNNKLYSDDNGLYSDDNGLYLDDNGLYSDDNGLYESDYESLDKTYYNESYYEELYNKLFNNYDENDPTLYHFRPSL